MELSQDAALKSFMQGFELGVSELSNCGELQNGRFKKFKGGKPPLVPDHAVARRAKRHGPQASKLP